MNKYHNIKCELDGIKFDSKTEMNRYSELKLMLRQGMISELTLQPKFLIVPKQPGERAVYYIGDFQYIEERTKIIVVEDVKGVKTPVYNLKRKLFKLKNPEKKFVETR